MNHDVSTPVPAITVVVPAVDEEQIVERAVRSATGVGVDVLVVDGGSADRTAAVAERLGAVVLHAPRGRATQMNAGLRAARGEIVVFLHADTTLPPGWADEVRRVLAGEGVVAGAFGLRIDGRHVGLRCVELGVAMRSRWLGMPYGDQALFARVSTLRDLGGFRDLPVMEDFDLVRRVRRLGRLRIARTSVVTSARRWARYGWLRNTVVNQIAVVAYLLGVDPRRIRGWLRPETARLGAEHRHHGTGRTWLPVALVVAGALGAAVLYRALHLASAAPLPERVDDRVLVGGFDGGLDGASRLRGDGSGSAAVLVRRLDLDPGEYPRRSPRWRVDAVPVGGDLRTQEGDDAVRGSALRYVGATPVGTVLSVGSVSGSRKDATCGPTTARPSAGRTRITGVAVMVDTDQTGGDAAPELDDLAFRRNATR